MSAEAFRDYIGGGDWIGDTDCQLQAFADEMEELERERDALRLLVARWQAQSATRGLGLAEYAKTDQRRAAHWMSLSDEAWWAVRAEDLVSVKLVAAREGET